MPIEKFWYVTAQDIAGDEPFSIFHAQMSVPGIIEELGKGNNPPLFEIFLHYWTGWFGTNPFSVRFLPCFFAVITVLLIYRIGSKHFGFRVALIASLLYSFSNFYIYFSHEARVYALFSFLTTASFLLFMDLGNGQGGWVKKALFALVNVLLLYAHYFGPIVILIQILAVILIGEYRRRFIRYLLVPYVVTGVLYLPWLTVLFKRFLSVGKEGTWLTPPDSIEWVYALVVEMSNKPVVAVIFIVILLIRAVLALVSKKVNSVSKESWLVMLWFLLPVFGIWGISYIMPLFLGRYLLFSTIGFYFLVAIAIDSVFVKKYARRGLAIIALGGMVFTFIPNPTNHSDISTMVSYIQDLKSQSRNKVYLCPDYRDLSFIYYYNRSWYKYANHPEGRMYVRRLLENDNIYPIASKAGVRVNEFVDFEEIIYIDAAADFSYPGNGILKTLEDSLSQKKKRHFDLHFEVYVFE